MVDVVVILLAIGLILFFGKFAEFIFKKLNIPDVLFLIVLGFILGPILGYVSGSQLATIAPIFTTFTLVFLIFDGAFNIRLSSLVRELAPSLGLTSFNFFISSLVIAVITGVSFYFLNLWNGGQTILISLLMGFMLGGVSSSFVIPILKQTNVGDKLYSLLTLESALTDVFCIVFSLTILKIINLGEFGLAEASVGLVSQFAVAAFIGVIAGVVWIFLSLKVFKESNYMITIAYLLLVYALTENLRGSGAIAALFFGLILKNSKQLTSILAGIKSDEKKKKKQALQGGLGVSIIKPSEEHFYHQISFFLKTFFFVYIGILIDITDYRALIIGGIISLGILFSRFSSRLLTKSMDENHRSVVDWIFARGLAAAVIAQLALEAGIAHADFLAKVVYVVITGTIILSSIGVFWVKRKLPAIEGAA